LFNTTRYRDGSFYPHVVLTVVKAPVKTGWAKPQKTHINWATLIFTARRNARITNAVLAIAIPSVTHRYCVKTTARSTVQFALSDSKMCLVL